MAENRLTRSETDRVIAGVCGGVAHYLEVDPVLVRLLFVLLTFASGMGVVIYLILWFIMPLETSEANTAVLRENLDDWSQTLNNSARRLSQPGTFGVVLIMLGAFFLLNQLGWFGWLGGLFWPLLIIGFGIYLLARRNQRNQ
jgi:phage shock protein PspC (stress-responsive transcriptional regulator)